MNNAQNISCPILYRPKDACYGEAIRQFQGCPTVALTPRGRIYLGWYAGGTGEPHMENYNLLVYSDDEGKTWSEPLLVIPSSKEFFIHALDIQLWTDPSGALHVFWVQNNTEPAPEVRPEVKPGQPLLILDGYMFNDFTHSCWEMICRDPDADEPVFSAPRYLDRGFLRCKPLVMQSGAWLNLNYDQMEDRYGYSISYDKGATYEHRYGPQKLATYYDECMAYQKKDGSIRMLARTWLGELGESYSYDGGKTWTDAVLSGIDSANSRFYVARMPSGRLLLVTNDDRVLRKNMTLQLSEDDGATWPYKHCIDVRDNISYPDADVFGDTIYLAYDRERTGAKEILFTKFTEQDIIDGTVTEPWVISKP